MRVIWSRCVIFLVSMGVAWPYAVAAPTPCVKGEKDPGIPCSFGITDPGLQLTNGAIKFQARISKAKMPIEEGEIDKVVLKLIDSTNQTPCEQAFKKVRIENSILNLDFQPPNCAGRLDQILAQNSDLALQLVIDDAPLKAIPMGTVPYALKSNFTVQAQQAHQADVAGQAHYAHRMTADRSTFVKNEIGTGYFDFYTHPDGGDLYSRPEDYMSHAHDGFIQWMPVRNPEKPVLHICAKKPDDTVQKLDLLHLQSKTTAVHGDLVVDGKSYLGNTQAGTEGHVNETMFAVYSSAQFNGAVKFKGGVKIEGSFTAAHEHSGAEINGKVASAVSADNALSAGSVPWTGVTGKPDTFVPSEHRHRGTEIDGKVDSAVSADNALSAGSVPWTGVTGKPEPWVADRSITNAKLDLDYQIITAQTTQNQSGTGVVDRRCAPASRKLCFLMMAGHSHHTFNFNVERDRSYSATCIITRSGPEGGWCLEAQSYGRGGNNCGMMCF